MRRLLVWAVLWTAVVIAVLLLWPSGVGSETGCWRLVDAPPACLAHLAELNDRRWWTQTLPMIAFLSSGHLVVGVYAARRVLRSHH